MKKIVIVDYGAGNIASIRNMLKKAGSDAEYGKDVSTIEKAEKLIIPGVGAFDYGMQQLRKSGLIDILNRKVLIEKIPVLGICLGLQLMTSSSEEGIEKGLGWIDSKTIRFKQNENFTLKIPHMGWNDVRFVKKISLLENMYENPRFYFVHSYHVQCNKAEDILGTANYGGYEFTCAVAKENIIGVQFHPEKSHKYGLLLLKNFAQLY